MTTTTKRIPTLLIVGVFSLAGCFDDATKNIKDASKHVEAASKNLQDGAKELAKVDPLALNHLLSTNDALRQQLIETKVRLQGLSTGSGVVVLRDRKVRVHIVQHTGSHRITGWIDNEKNWFWRDKRFDDKEAILQIDYAKVIEDYRNELISQIPELPVKIDKGHLADQMLGQKRPEIANKYRIATEASFKQFLKTSAVIPAPDTTYIDLQSQFLQPGDHFIHIQITPVAGDQNKRWSVQGELVSIAPGGEVERIKQFDIDSDSQPGCPMGKPLSPIAAFITVRQD